MRIPADIFSRMIAEPAPATPEAVPEAGALTQMMRAPDFDELEIRDEPAPVPAVRTWQPLVPASPSAAKEETPITPPKPPSVRTWTPLVSAPVTVPVSTQSAPAIETLSPITIAEPEQVVPIEHAPSLPVETIHIAEPAPPLSEAHFLNLKAAPAAAIAHAPEASPIVEVAAPVAALTSAIEVLAPAPDSPFGADSSFPSGDANALASLNVRVRSPAPSGANWRSVMDEVPVAAPKPVLVASGLVKWFGKREVVRGVDVEVGAGEIVGLLGRNGAGKTTTFRMIIGLLHPDGGKVTYANRDVTRLPMYARANRGIGYLAQQPSIFQKLTVEENLMAVLELQEPSSKQRKARMEELITSLGLETVRRSQAAVLSGGERRRLEIARAMSLRPSIVLFDEPFAGIDPITVTEIQGILKDLKSKGVGVLLTDHNVRETLTITDRTYIMDEGKIWIHGHPRDIVANEEARSRYLGHEFRLDF